jgi:hypothetical protein
LAITKRIAELSKALANSEQPFLTHTLIDQLKTLHSMAGSTMPNTQLLGDVLKQIDWTSQGGAA